jgi:hypothetical protein
MSHATNARPMRLLSSARSHPFRRCLRVLLAAACALSRSVKERKGRARNARGHHAMAHGLDVIGEKGLFSRCTINEAHRAAHILCCSTCTVSQPGTDHLQPLESACASCARVQSYVQAEVDTLQRSVAAGAHEPTFY